jgi:hypothetical protein
MLVLSERGLLIYVDCIKDTIVWHGNNTILFLPQITN